MLLGSLDVYVFVFLRNLLGSGVVNPIRAPRERSSPANTEAEWRPAQSTLARTQFLLQPLSQTGSPLTQLTATPPRSTLHPPPATSSNPTPSTESRLVELGGEVAGLALLVPLGNLHRTPTHSQLRHQKQQSPKATDGTYPLVCTAAGKRTEETAGRSGKVEVSVRTTGAEGAGESAGR